MGCLKRVLQIVGGLVVLVIALVIVVALMNPRGDTASEAVSTQDSVKPAAVVVENSDAAAENSDAAIDDGTDQGITFSAPLVFEQSGFQVIALLATNKSNQVKTFTVQATFKLGDTIAAVASGTVNDLLAGQTKAVMLISSDDVPAQYDAVRVNVDTMVLERDSTPGGDAGQHIHFGSPVVSGTSGLQMINVEVTNQDEAMHTFTVQAALLRDGQLVGLGNGTINDLAPGQTKTANLLIQGEIENTDIVLNVDTLVQ